MTTPNDNYIDVNMVMQCARKAGQAALGFFRKEGVDAENKLNDSDIVTIADRTSESIIKDFVAAHFPSHAILSEESGETAGTDTWRWVVDPVDGTTNFFAGLPLWAVSIGVEHNGEAVAGVVYLPFTDEMFHAVRGGGAYLNGKPIHVSAETALSRSVLSTGFPVDKDSNPDNNIDNFSRVMPKVRGIRRLGSAATDICYVAAGFLQGYWEMNLHLWDVCAARLILEEAGGVWSSFRSDRNVSILCTTPSLHPLLASLIS